MRIFFKENIPENRSESINIIENDGLDFDVMPQRSSQILHSFQKVIYWYLLVT